MFELIGRLRKKNIEERRRVAFMTAFVITAIIALMWFIWLLSGGLSARMKPETPQGGTPIEGVWAPLKRTLRSFIGGLKD